MVVDYGQGPGALRTMREETAVLSELAYDGPTDRFAARISTYHMRSALLLETHMPRVQNDRSPLLVARSPIDHYLVVLYLRGRCWHRIGSREVVIGPGDIGIIDLSFAGRTAILPAGGDRFARFVTMILPRTVLAPLLRGSSALGQQLIRGDSPYGRILRELILELQRSARDLTMAESEPVVHAVARLVAGSVRPARRSALEPDPTLRAATRAAMLSFLERTDTSPEELGVAALCRRFGISRATLYRMFESEGGLVHHVRERLLRRALGVLASPAHRHRRIVDIAVQHGFTSESGFIRAFRRLFGTTPGEIRSTPPLAHAASGAAAQRAMSWLLALGGPSLPHPEHNA